MILKVEDALKSLRRTPACRNGSTGRDPDCEASRDLIGLYSPQLVPKGPNGQNGQRVEEFK